MKRNSVLSTITLSVALSAILTGCGGTSATSGSDTGNDNNTPSASITGKAVDGYLQYATVCLDLSEDGYCQPSEPSTQTDENGAFTLTLTEEAKTDPNFDTAMLLVYGGKDVDTGDDFTGKLLAPKEGKSVILSPVSTLVAKTLQKELKKEKKLSKEELKAKIEAAKNKVAQVLELDPKELDADPVAEQEKGNDKLIKKALQLQKAVEAMLAAEPDETKHTERAEKIYEAIADVLQETTPQEKGVDRLLDKTLQKAEQDDRVKALLGGDQGIRAGAAAKEVAKAIKKHFDEADPNIKKRKDFLKKVAVVTREDLKKVKVAIEEGKTEDEIRGEISVDNPFAKPDFDWGKKFIAHDLDLAGIAADDTLIEKLKTLLEGEEIEPGTLFKHLDALKNSGDQDIQNIYDKLQKFVAQKEAEREAQEAQMKNRFIAFKPPMTLYLPHGNKYEEVSFNEDNTLSVHKYRAQNGTFVPKNSDGENQNSEYILQNGSWVAASDESAQPFTMNADGTLTMTEWNEKVSLLEGKDIAGKTITIPQLRNLAVTMPDNAKMYFIKVEKQKDTYRIDEPVTSHQNGEETVLHNFGEFIQNQCQTNWFIGNQDHGLAFAGTQNADGSYQCDANAKSGKLVTASAQNSDVENGKIAGEWKIKEVDGQEIMIIKPYSKKYLEDDEGDIEYKIFAVKDGTLYRGGLEPKGIVRNMPAFNGAAMDAIKNSIANSWKYRDLMNEQ